jgi:hypothetical protein
MLKDVMAVTREFKDATTTVLLPYLDAGVVQRRRSREARRQPQDVCGVDNGARVPVTSGAASTLADLDAGRLGRTGAATVGSHPDFCFLLF